MAASVTTSVKLAPETKARVQRLAEARRRSAHWVIREAIEQYVQREERREQFKQDALAAWNEFQDSGLHVTGDEADAWLGRLQKSRGAKPPKPHR